jgi:hypothetical protein
MILVPRSRMLELYRHSPIHLLVVLNEAQGQLYFFFLPSTPFYFSSTVYFFVSFFFYIFTIILIFLHFIFLFSSTFILFLLFLHHLLFLHTFFFSFSISWSSQLYVQSQNIRGVDWPPKPATTDDGIEEKVSCPNPEQMCSVQMINPSWFGTRWKIIHLEIRS